MPRTRHRGSTTALRVAVGAHRCGAAKMLRGRPDRRCGIDCATGQFAGQLAAPAQRRDVVGLAVVAVLDSRRHVGIGRDQRHAPPRARLHQRHPDMWPVGMPGGAVAGHRHESARVRPDLEIVGGAEHHLEHRPSGGHRPIRGQHPFGMIAERRPHRQRRHHRHPGGGQHRLVADAREHEQVGRLNRTGAQHDSVGSQGHLTVRTDRVDAHRDGAGKTQPGGPRPRTASSGSAGPGPGSDIPRRSSVAHRRRC